MRAARRPRFGAGRLGHAAGPPARALDHPRDDVLDPAEDGAAPAGRLVGAKAVVRVDVVPHQLHGSLLNRSMPKGSPVEAREQAILETAKQHPADRYHVVTALVRGSLSGGVKLVAKA